MHSEIKSCGEDVFSVRVLSRALGSIVSSESFFEGISSAEART